MRFELVGSIANVELIAAGPVRVVDESGEDYLYHKSHFSFVDFPPAVKKKLLALQGAA